MKNLMPVPTKYGTVWVNLDWIVTIHDGLYGGVIVCGVRMRKKIR